MLYRTKEIATVMGTQILNKCKIVGMPYLMAQSNSKWKRQLSRETSGLLLQNKERNSNP